MSKSTSLGQDIRHLATGREAGPRPLPGRVVSWWEAAARRVPVDLGTQCRVSVALERLVSQPSACGDGCDGLVVVPLGARELLAVGVGVLFPVLAVPQEAGEGSGAGTRELGPVVQAEVPRSVHRAVGGEHGPGRR